MQSNFSKDYFDLFGLPVSYNVEKDKLAQRYRELQYNVHPDKFTTSSDQERRLSMQLAAHVNEAFQTLKNPMLRARYLLDLRGVNPDQRDIAMNPDFLGEQIELRERLAAISAGGDTRDDLSEIKRELVGRHEALQRRFSDEYETGTADSLRTAGMIFLELQFIDKLLQEIATLETEV